VPTGGASISEAALPIRPLITLLQISINTAVDKRIAGGVEVRWGAWIPPTSSGRSCFDDSAQVFTNSRCSYPNWRGTGVTNTSMGFFSVVLEPPDPEGWMFSGPFTSNSCKNAVLLAYQKLHDNNVLHGFVHPRHVLIGKLDFHSYPYSLTIPRTHLGLNGKATLINFERAQLLDPEDITTPDILQQELKRVRRMLGLNESIQAHRNEMVSSRPSFKTVKRKRVEAGDPVGPAFACLR
jgi:hypothetical protein